MDASRRKHSPWFRSGVAIIVLLVGYPVSLGPACWITSRFDFTVQSLGTLYLPIWKVITPPRDPGAARAGYSGSINSSIPLPGLMSKYATLFAASGWEWEHDVTYVYEPGEPSRMTQESWHWRYSRYRDDSPASRELRLLRFLRELETERRRARGQNPSPKPRSRVRCQLNSSPRVGVWHLLRD
jgi:hypothetical protein